MKKILVSFFGLVFFSAHVWAGAVVPSSSIFTSEVLNGAGVIRQSNVYTFPSSTVVPPVSVTNDNVYPISGGSGSIAANAAKAALGVAAAGAALFSSPAIVGTLVAAQIGMIGYDFYQSLKSNNINFDSSGNASVNSDPHFLSYCSSGGCASTPAGVVALQNTLGYIPGQLTLVCAPSPFSYACTSNSAQFCGGTCFGISGQGALQPSGLIPATNSQIVSAINAATASTVAAVDAVRLAIQQGVNIPSLLPASTPNLNSSVAPAVVLSPEVLVATNTDSNGVATRTMQYTSTQLTPPAVAGDSAQVVQITTSKDIVGNSTSPSAVRSVVSTPVAAAPVSTAVPSTAAPVNIPTDYNREATQAKIMDALGVTPSASLPSNELADITALTGDSGGIPVMNRGALSGAVTLPSSTNSCVPLDMVIHGIHFNVDPCPMINYLHPLVNYLFIFLFGILNLRTALKNDELAGAA